MESPQGREPTRGLGTDSRMGFKEIAFGLLTPQTNSPLPPNAYICYMKMNFLLALCLLGVVTAQGQSLYINELVASNNQDQMDEFFEFDDWIEIYNTGGITNLAGYFLSDDPDSLDKYLIPNDPALTTILPNGYLIFWCDKDNATQGSNHTNFTLKSSGETVYLTAPDGMTIIDSVSYPQMASDISYGRSCDGCPTWQYFNNTTWNAMNQELINPNGELLFINEVQSMNTHTIHDLAFEFDPWMEIYNPNTFQVNLAGYQIANSNGVYTIPINSPVETIIPAGEFRVLWFDHDLTQGAMHLDLDLLQQGSLQLLAPNGNAVVDAVNYNLVAVDHSWGRSSDGGSSWITFNVPTPTATNNLFIIPGYAVKINEVMAKNLTTWMDNYGEYEDWVEIYNPLGTAVNLSGYYFSDNPEIRNKWQIPGTFPDSVTVPAHGWRLFFCDADLNQGVLHNNFSLSNGGEYVGLFGPDGFSLVDEVQWTFMGADTTYGRLYDGDVQWVQFTTFTTVSPEASNGVNPTVQELHSTEWRVFPNPTMDILQFNGPVSARIYNEQGLLVMNLKNQTSMNVQDWAAGSYMIVRDDGRAVRWIKK